MHRGHICRLVLWLAFFRPRLARVGGAPVAQVRRVMDDYFGTKIVGPYRYMEDLKDPQVQAWFKAQNAYTRAVLAKIPDRDALLKRIQEIDQSTPAKVTDVKLVPGDRYFYQKMVASEIIARLYIRDGLDGKERLLLDPAKYPAPPRSHNTINYYSPSWDGKMVAVGVSPGGSENATIHTVEADTGKEWPEVIDRSRLGGVAWRADNHSFFYNRLQKIAPGMEKSMVYLHAL